MAGRTTLCFSFVLVVQKQHAHTHTMLDTTSGPGTSGTSFTLQPHDQAGAIVEQNRQNNNDADLSVNKNDLFN